MQTIRRPSQHCNVRPKGCNDTRQKYFRSGLFLNHSADKFSVSFLRRNARLLLIRKLGNWAASSCSFEPKISSDRFVSAKFALIVRSTKQNTDCSESGMARVAIFTTLGCKYCREAKAALKSKNLDYIEYDLSSQLHILQAVKKLTGRQTVPQVFIGGQLIGGCSETLELLNSGKLQTLVAEANNHALPDDLRKLVSDRRTVLQDYDSLMTPDGMSSTRFQQLRKLGREMQLSELPGLHWQGLKPVADTFTSEETVKWMMKENHASSHNDCLTQLREMQAAHLVELLNSTDNGQINLAKDKKAGNFLWRLTSDSPLPGKRDPLNAAFLWKGPARPASKVAEILRSLILVLFEKHLSADGRSVNYQALSQDPDFQLFLIAAAELQAVDPTPLSRTERIAFFLNVYNVLIVHAQAILGGPSNLLSRLRWFGSIRYCIGGQQYSANDLEHGVLRGNRPPSSALPVLLGRPEWANPLFDSHDPRLCQVVKEMDKRIHFALNCGARSCPPIKVYTPDTLEEGLQSATAAFLESEVEVDIVKKAVKLSKIFKWYQMDFGNKDGLLKWLVDNLPERSAQALHTMLSKTSPSRIRLKYKDYDWDLNKS